MIWNLTKAWYTLDLSRVFVEVTGKGVSSVLLGSVKSNKFEIGQTK